MGGTLECVDIEGGDWMPDLYGDWDRVCLSKCKIKDDDLKRLEGLNPRIMYLDKTDITDAGLEHLRNFTRLEELQLTSTTVTDNGVKRLQQTLPNCVILH
jgi:hypothetical protein